MLTKTTTQLIEGLRDPANSTAWTTFDARYRPILKAFARRLGFNEESSIELAQQTLAEFARSYAQGRYQRSQGRLSSWLIGIARNVGSGMRRKAGACPRVGSDSALGDVPAHLPDDQQLTQIWEKERDLAILAEAMTVLRESTRTDEHTIRAFELFVVRGLPADEVANACSISTEAVYVIKNRLTKKLREIVNELTHAYDEGA